MGGPASIREVGVADVPTSFDESVVLLDVREDDEWQRGHAPGALHIPMGEVSARIGEIDADATLFVAQNGYTPVNVSGGMQAWADSGRPVVTDGGGVGTI
jgi:rhodanese-related sulfurtransferase